MRAIEYLTGTPSAIVGWRPESAGIFISLGQAPKFPSGGITVSEKQTRVTVELRKEEDVEAFLVAQNSISKKVGLKLSNTQVVMWLINNTKIV